MAGPAHGIVPRMLVPAASASFPPVRTVVVGYGRAGKGFHCQLVRRTAGMILHGVVSGDESKRLRIPAEQEGARAYASLDSALADPKVELVVVATPSGTHAAVVRAGLDAGRHVVCDKPLCFTAAEAAGLFQLAAARRVHLSVFHNRRWDGDFLTVRNLVGQGVLGDVRWLELAWQGRGAGRGWRGEEGHGGRFFDLGPHLSDQLCLLAGEEPATVYGKFQYDYAEAPRAPSGALAVVTFPSGRVGVIDTGGWAGLPKPRWYLLGTRGSFRKSGLDPQENALMAGDIDIAVEDPAACGVLHDGEAERTVPTQAGRWRCYYEQVAASLRGVGEPPVRSQEVVRYTAVLEGALISAREGREVDVAALIPA